MLGASPRRETTAFFRTGSSFFLLDVPNVLGYIEGMDTKLKCNVHGIPLVCYCPACRGAVTSKRKAEASRQNGKLGGRPRKNKAELN